MACTAGKFRPYQYVLWRLCWNWGCQVQLSRVAKELMQFASSPFWVLDIYVRRDDAGWLLGCLVHPFHVFIMPWPTRCRVSTSHVYRRNYNLVFLSWISSYHTEYHVWVRSVLLRIWHVLGSDTGCVIWRSAWLKTPLPLPPDCQSVWYCSSCCVYVCPPIGVYRIFIFIPCKKIRYKVKQPTTCTSVFCF